MVFHVTIATSIRDIVRDPVDQIHNLVYEGNTVQKECYPSTDILDFSTGKLWLNNIQCPERPVVKALAKYHRFIENQFRPDEIPQRNNFYLFPTFFELERLARDPIVIGTIQSLDSDGRNLNPDNTYFQEQATELNQFAQSYAMAKSISPLQKPVLQGFYERMCAENTRTLAELRNPGYTELQRTAKKGRIWQEEDFVSAFGGNIYWGLKNSLGEPRFS